MAAERYPPGYVLRVCDEALKDDLGLAKLFRDVVEKSLAANPAYQYAVDLGQLAPLRITAIDREDAERFVQQYLSNRLSAGQRWGNIKMPSLCRLS